MFHDFLNNTPILLIAFNRPDTTEAVFESIGAVKPAKLYIAIDGPRSDKQGEAELCSQVIKITKDIDWKCDVNYLIRDTNLGCKKAVTDAISWALLNEDRIIIIEDDIVPGIPFYKFVSELLERFKDDERIVMISGNNYSPFGNMEEDYLFSKYGHIWGWATWKRAWDKFDVNIPEIEDSIKNGYNDFNFTCNEEKKYFDKYFRSLHQRIKAGTENAWGPQFVFYRFKNNLLSIVPRVNLASNIGINSSRTDTVSLTTENTNYWPSDNSFLIRVHPETVIISEEYELTHFRDHINIKTPFGNRIVNKIRRTVKSILR
jgi:hypothetical protein